MKNELLVFGLQRSGTCFLQWSLLNNFTDIDLDVRTFDIGNIKGMANYGSKQAVKHLTPTLKYSKFIVGIYKDFDKWKESALKTHHLRSPKLAYEIWENWHIAFDNIDPKYTMKINHSDLVHDYDFYLQKIQEKFSYTLISKPIQPKKYLSRGATLTNKDYIHQQ